MYPDTSTHTEELIELIKSNSPKITDILKEYIDKHDTSKMEEGVRYYFNKSDITRRKIYTYENDQKVLDEDATNNKIPTGWHKTLVDQKVSYLVGQPISINSKEENDPSLEEINEVLGDELDDTLPELVKNASNKGKEWLHVYVDEQGNFDYMIIPAQQFIPIYDNTKRKNLIAGIRLIPLDDDTLKIEFWDDKQVTFFEKIDGEIVIDASVEVNPQAHFYYGDTGYPWSKDGKVAIPFIKFANNEEEVNDLTFYKQLIDAFELIISDTTNTLEDIQSFIYVLKGYEGTDLNQFITELKRYKVISVSDEQGAGVDTVKAEIPIEAVEAQLNRLVDMIYQAGQGVNVNTDKFGNSPSGVALEFLYSLLNMKANILERKFTKSLKQLMWFVCEYLSIANNTEVDFQNYSFTFNKSMITNEAEKVTMAKDSMGVISNKTIRANHPWVTDAQQEELQMEEEAKKRESTYPEIQVNEDESE
ncbi:phage portal protein [Ornithinibacillus xuwenensis]|uniref:Phage portal protein n=1 Tax=Ornithinibacillus xuwenensis TaxID=3144668 RepID=A0ABU9XC56_9BACI